MSAPKWAALLTYAGTLPFIGVLVLLIFNVDLLGWHVRWHVVATTYGVVIVSFISGIHWGAYLFARQRPQINLFVTSNVITLLAFCSYLLFPYTIVYPVLIFCFVVLYILDVGMRRQGVYEGWFYNLRRNATVIVVLSLLILIFV